jgi:hypothetical protein
LSSAATTANFGSLLIALGSAFGQARSVKPPRPSLGKLEGVGHLHDKGMIDNPVGKVKSVVFTQEGLERAKTLFEEMFEK